MKDGKLIAPNGRLIVGTLDTVQVKYPFNPEKVALDVDGTVDLSYLDFDVAEPYWETAETMKEDGESLFLDDEGGEWKESNLRFEPNLDEGDPVTVRVTAAIGHKDGSWHEQTFVFPVNWTSSPLFGEDLQMAVEDRVGGTGLAFVKVTYWNFKEES